MTLKVTSNQNESMVLTNHWREKNYREQVQTSSTRFSAQWKLWLESDQYRNQPERQVTCILKKFH